jgi:hypothetical protein
VSEIYETITKGYSGYADGSLVISTIVLVMNVNFSTAAFWKESVVLVMKGLFRMTLNDLFFSGTLCNLKTAMQR